MISFEDRYIAQAIIGAFCFLSSYALLITGSSGHAGYGKKRGDGIFPGALPLTGLYAVILLAGWFTMTMDILFMGILFLTFFGGILIIAGKRTGKLPAGFLACLSVYLIVLLYFTMLSEARRAGTDTSIFMIPFYQMAAGNAGKAVMHFLMNTAMTVPLGVFTAYASDGRDGIKYGFWIGLATSAFIEGVQLMFGIGQCDINDILANTLGSTVGAFMFARLPVREDFL